MTKKRNVNIVILQDITINICSSKKLLFLQVNRQKEVENE